MKVTVQNVALDEAVSFDAIHAGGFRACLVVADQHEFGLRARSADHEESLEHQISALCGKQVLGDEQQMPIGECFLAVKGRERTRAAADGMNLVGGNAVVLDHTVSNML